METLFCSILPFPSSLMLYEVMECKGVFTPWPACSSGSIIHVSSMRRLLRASSDYMPFWSF